MLGKIQVEHFYGILNKMYCFVHIYLYPEKCYATPKKYLLFSTYNVRVINNKK